MIHARHILIRPEITETDLAMAAAKLDSIRSVILSDTIDFTVAVKRFSDENEQSYNNGGRMINNRSGDTFFETSELDPDIFFTIDSMEVDQLSSPFKFTNPQGESAYRIVQLQSRTDPHRANLTQDYTKIKQAAIEQQKSTYMNEWLEEKIQSTFVKIDPMMRNKCPLLDRWGAGMESVSGE